MGAVQALLQHEIQPNFNMYFSGTDLRDYYYCFRVTSRRAWRNAMEIAFDSFPSSLFSVFFRRHVARTGAFSMLEDFSDG